MDHTHTTNPGYREGILTQYLCTWKVLFAQVDMSRVLLEFVGIRDKATWHAWAKVNHPDKGGDGDKFRMVKDAYEELLAGQDKDNDTTGPARHPRPPPPSPPSSAGAAAMPSNFWANFAKAREVDPATRCVAEVKGAMGGVGPGGCRDKTCATCI